MSVICDNQHIAGRDFLCSFAVPVGVLHHVQHLAVVDCLNPIVKQFRLTDSTSAREHPDDLRWISKKCVQGLQLFIAAAQRLLEVEESRPARLEWREELFRGREDAAGTGSPFGIPVGNRKKQFRL